MTKVIAYNDETKKLCSLVFTTIEDRHARHLAIATDD
jgi:hypothetical protein